MRKIAAVLLVIGFAQASAFGGVVSFDPNPAYPDVGAGDSPLVKFDVFLSELTESGDLLAAFDIVFGAGVIGSDASGLEIVSFVLDPALVARQLFPSEIGIVDNSNPGFYLDDIKVGYFVKQFLPEGPFDLSLTGGSLKIGSLTVDATGMDIGDYEVVVDFDRDNSSFTTGPPAAPGQSFLFGSAFVKHAHGGIPEPGTISLLGLASLALIRRRV